MLAEIRALFEDAGTTGYVVAAADDPPWPGAESVEAIGIHVADMEDALAQADHVAVAPGLVIRAVDPADPADVARWNDVVLAGFGMRGSNADAWRRLAPALTASKGEHTFLATLEGRDVAAASLFTRRRVGWIGNATVLPEARGRGIQQALIAHRICAASGTGCRRVMATADVGSLSAANLEAMGLARIWTNALYRLGPAVAAVSELVRIERGGPNDAVARVTLDRPDVHNAFNASLIAELRQAFAGLSREGPTQLRAVVLAGDGPSFCAGADIDWMRAAISSTSRRTNRTRWRWPTCSRRSTRARCRSSPGSRAARSAAARGCARSPIS